MTLIYFWKGMILRIPPIFRQSVFNKEQEMMERFLVNSSGENNPSEFIILLKIDWPISVKFIINDERKEWGNGLCEFSKEELFF